MKAIIIAAGVGSRMGDLTKNLPKPLIDVNGKSILEHQISLYKKFGINDIIIITGYKKEKFSFENIKYVYDSNYGKFEQTASLMTAKHEISGDILISFGDIIFDELVLQQLLSTNYDIVLATDKNWKTSHNIRTENSTESSDFVALKNNQIFKFFKYFKEIPQDCDVVEFIGLMKLSNLGSKKIVEKYNSLEKYHSGVFHYASSFKKAKLIDFLEELHCSGLDIKIKNIDGKWCEIDTKQDLEFAKNIF